MYLLLQHPENIDWNWLSSNPGNYALDLLLQNPEYINFDWLSLNSNDRALDLLEANPDKIRVTPEDYPPAIVWKQ